MPTPKLVESLASKIASKSSYLYILFWACIGSLVLVYFLREGMSGLNWVTILFATSIYILLWCSALIFVNVNFGSIEKEKKSNAQKFTELLINFGQDYKPNSSFSSWYGSIFLFVYMLGLAAVPFFVFFLWLKNGS